MSDTRLRLGDMLVAAGLIDVTQLRGALASQKVSGRRLGEELVALGLITEVQMTQVLSNQLSVPWVSLYHVEFSRELLNLVTAELAQRYGLIPVYVRHVRKEGVRKEEVVFVAMDDPTNAEALEQIRAVTGMLARPMVAPPTEILNAIRVYYLGEAPAPPKAKPATAVDVVKPVAAKPMEAATAVEAANPPTTAEPARPIAERPVSEKPVSEKPVAEKPLAAGKPAETRPSPSPKRAAPSGARMVTLTLLDGTTVSLPARGESEKPPPQETLTASDLIAALLARAQGADVSSVLPDPEARWEVLFATLLTVLMRKGLIADWEFVEELKKREG